MVRFLYNYSSLASFSKILRANTTAAAAAHYDHICVDDFRLIARRKL